MLALTYCIHLKRAHKAEALKRDVGEYYKFLWGIRFIITLYYSLAWKHAHINTSMITYYDWDNILLTSFKCSTQIHLI